MKKTISLALATVSALATFASCGTVTEKFDPNKTQIFVNVFNGGFGDDWYKDLKTRFNAINEDYEIILRPKKLQAKDIILDVASPNPDADVYFSCGVDFQSGIYKDYFEDLSDVLSMKPDGQSGQTVGEKIVDLDLWKQVSSKYGEGVYMLPHAETMMGMVFDYKLFVENRWLDYATAVDEAELTSQGISFTKNKGVYTFVGSTGPVNYREGDILLTAGKDGKFGTYDDGQPQTMEDFDAMLANIANGNKKAKTFIYSGVAENYLNEVYCSVIAQYMGADKIHTLFDFDSNGENVEMHDGSEDPVTIETGFKIYQSEAVYQGLRFVDEYFVSPDVDDRVEGYSGFSHTKAQDAYLMGYKDTTGFPAMLVEGNWWEYEARETFKEIGKRKADRAYGKREYRYMLIPSIEGQATESNKSVVCGAEYSSVVVAKQKNAEKLAKIKEFLAFCASDESLKNFTKYSGCRKYYNYSLSAAEKASLTPFARNALELMSDSENVTVVPSRIYKFSNPLTFTSDFIQTNYVPLLAGAVYTQNTARFFRDTVKLADLYGNKSNCLGYSASEWSKLLVAAKANGFFND